MPFDLCNAPATFMKLMNDALHPYLDSFVIVYLDYMLIYRSTSEDHISHLMHVLETLKKHQMLANLNKFEFSQRYLVSLGYVTNGVELKIDPTNMEAIMKWTVPTNFAEVISLFGVPWYLRKFIASFLAVPALLHTITMSGKSFQWGKNQHKVWKEMKINISQAPIPALPNLQNPFKVEIDATRYFMGAFYMQLGRPVCYHFEIFHGEVLNYPTYDKELCALLQDVKKWKNYLMGKDTIIHTYHQPLQCLKA
jgi:hypothetical protein